MSGGSLDLEIRGHARQLLGQRQHGLDEGGDLGKRKQAGALDQCARVGQRRRETTGARLQCGGGRAQDLGQSGQSMRVCRASFRVPAAG